MSSIVINYRYQSVAIGDWYRVYRLVSDIDFYRSTTPVSLVTSCNNSSRRQITPCVQVGRLVAATRWETRRSDKSLRVYWRIFVKICLHNRILPLQQVAKSQIRLNLCDLLRRQNSVAATKIFTKIQYAKRTKSKWHCINSTLLLCV